MSPKLIHSFSRPKRNEKEEEALDRALGILMLIKDIGLVLAPEIVEWDLHQLVPGQKPLRILQRRLCLTDLSAEELPEHSKVFGPLALSFDSSKLREAGALPAIYIPQGLSTAISLIGAFCVNGTYHTKYVLSRLQELKNLSDPQKASQMFGKPVAPDYALNLSNTDASGDVVAKYSISATTVQNVLQHVGFNNIPFDHSVGILDTFLNMFCPTDNLHASEQLGYYRQREWRLIASEICINNHRNCRELSDIEKQSLVNVDSGFWNGELEVDGKSIPRKDLALIYDPVPGWKPLGLVESIHAPVATHARIKHMLGDKIPVYGIN